MSEGCGLCDNNLQAEGGACPRILRCGHIFCTNCISGLLDVSKAAVVCPVDRIATPASTPLHNTNDPQSLMATSIPKHFAVISMLRLQSDQQQFRSCEVCAAPHPATHWCRDCAEFMCEAITEAHQRAKMSRHHTLLGVEDMVLVEEGEGAGLCNDHSQPFVAFDTQCECLVCVKCLTARHVGHVCVDLDEACGQILHEVNAVSAQGKGVVEQLEVIGRELKKLADRLERDTASARSRIKDTFERLRDCLNAREQSLLQRIHHTHKTMSLDLHDRHQCISNQIANMKYLLLVCKQSKASTSSVGALTRLRQQVQTAFQNATGAVSAAADRPADGVVQEWREVFDTVSVPESETSALIQAVSHFCNTSDNNRVRITSVDQPNATSSSNASSLALGHAECLKVMLEVGGQRLVNKSNQHAITPLIAAAQHGQLACVTAIIESGGNVNKSGGSGGFTPVQYAAQMGHVECVELLVAAGADPNKTDPTGANAVLVAAQNGREKCILALVKAGADVNKQNVRGFTSLHAACANGNAGCVRVLLESDAVVSLCDKAGASPLWLAAKFGHAECVEAMLRSDADVNQCDQSGSSALKVAAQNGHVGCVLALVAGGGNVNQCNRSGVTPLYAAASRGVSECVKALIAAGAVVNPEVSSLEFVAWCDVSRRRLKFGAWWHRDGTERDLSEESWRQMPQHMQAEYRKVNRAEDLGCDVGVYWKMPILIASWRGHPECVKMLFDAGALADHKYFGWSAVDVARARGHQACVDLLLPR
eukprot:c11361_g1_i1.p1 GENE.c11361_g1_i1~~c11361_g1_i1.p1  ORF type:complete len:774 (+),score=173.86 c11361_g1_i1:30-2324(+)